MTPLRHFGRPGALFAALAIGGALAAGLIYVAAGGAPTAEAQGASIVQVTPEQGRARNRRFSRPRRPPAR